MDKVEIDRIIDLYKPHMKDIKFDDIDSAINAKKYNIVQVKFDGWWSIIQIDSRYSQANIYSSGGELKEVINLPSTFRGNSAVFIGEYLYGTNWSKNNEMYLHLYIHDTVSVDEPTFTRDYRNEPYHLRYKAIHTYFGVNEFLRFHIVPSFTGLEWRNIWAKYVERDGFEGIVLKHTNAELTISPPARCKKNFSYDYVFMGVNEGTGKYVGTTGSIIGGLYDSGILKPVLSVGGLSDEMRDLMWLEQDNYQGRVFEATGKALYKSGCLRHPNFLRFRQDKKPMDCKMPEEL